MLRNAKVGAVTQNICLVTGTSPIYGEVTQKFDMSIEEFKSRWMLRLQGVPIQDAFDTSTPTQQEFLISGTPDHEWEKMFPKITSKNMSEK